MAASGINLKNINQLQTLRDYSEPLIQFMSSLPDDQKVVLVGHSLGGMNIALAMEMFPHKIHVAVFLAAFMPDSTNTPSFIFDQFGASMAAEDDYWLDTEFKSSGDPKETLTTMFFGSRFLIKLYRLSSPQDYELAMTLRRPSSLFQNDLWRPETKLSKERYGSVRRVYVISDQDEAIPPHFQRWMIQNANVKEVFQLRNSDHMAMLCQPKQLSNYLLHIIH
ncbi:salicylic acid-binding protein 2-like [Amaranthus tricolor]|uniref:salicylic acid-binding protein 2-like n=1 Tax=Amaranthus tricolor TaxID=29722 RepID=UPI00258582EB|nr:salicylic acid-binding protein 2-like [Amaranthus tricolor]